jgi:hypothetical protein
MFESILTQVVQALVAALVGLLCALVVKGLKRLGLSADQAQLQTDAMAAVNKYELAKKIVLGIEEDVAHLVKTGKVPVGETAALKAAQFVEQALAQIPGLNEAQALQLSKTALAELGLGASGFPKAPVVVS